MTKALIIFGEHTADEVRSAALRCAEKPWSRIEKCFFDPVRAQESVHSIARQFPGAWFNVGIADNVMRRKVALVAEGMGLVPLTIVDPSALVDPTARVEAGCFVAANSVISTSARLARYTLVHFNATVGHNSTVGEFNTILPGARLSGFVETGSGVMIGSNSFIFQGVKIGSDAKIDAMTYVKENVPERRVVSGRRELSL